MHFNLVDLALVVLAAAAAVDGARRGFTTYATELTAFALALGVAFVLFEPISAAMHSFLGVPLGLAGFGVFLILLVLTHGAVQASLHGRLGWLSRRLHLEPRAGALPAVGVAVLVSAVALSALVVLPGGSYRSLVLGSTLGSTITHESSFLQPPMARLLVPANREAQPLVTVPKVPPDAGEDAFYRLQFPDQLDTQIDLQAEDRMLQLVNKTRAEGGFKALSLDPLLQEAAREHSLDMYQRHYFSHLTPDGKSPFDRMRAHGAHFVTAGENIAFAPDVDQAYQSLLASPDHRANLLNPDFRCIGIGVYRAVGYEEMFTQDFSDCA
ncbi:MAG TPA: CAP domain-containing protein [Candidatus Dormibacteraeota bacterium]